MGLSAVRLRGCDCAGATARKGQVGALTRSYPEQVVSFPSPVRGYVHFRWHVQRRFRWQTRLLGARYCWCGGRCEKRCRT